MTDEELNALMADMDRRASQAFDADARAKSEAAETARTPSMLVRDAMRADGGGDASEESAAEDDGSDAKMASDDDLDGADDATAVDDDIDREDEGGWSAAGAADGSMDDDEDHETEGDVLRLDDRIEEPAVEDQGVADDDTDTGDGSDPDARRVSLRVDRTQTPDEETPREPRVSLRVEKPAGTDGAADEGRVSLRAEGASTSRSISRRRADLAPDAVQAAEPDRKKPRVMLMGEFSAGKSTLMNLLLGEPALPVNTTATQLPPVWISKGDDDQPMRVDLEGFEEPVDLSSPDIPIADTHYIRLQKKVDLLDLCDLIDTPGISDPNMPAEVWQRMVQHADIVIWCTHATQAWRQSEAAAWAMMPQKLQKRSLLLLTRFDKVASDRDRLRVLKRVRMETDEVFRDIFPISLTEAIAAGDDKEAFAASGGESFADALFEVIGLIERKDKSVRTRPRSQIAPFKLEPEPEPQRMVTPRRVRPRPLAARPLSSRSGASRDGV